MKLYDYYRSSASYRVRIALVLKGLPCKRVSIDLKLGEQKGERFRQVNPQGLVPVLETDHGRLTQSLAILEYLDEVYPARPLLAGDPWTRAQQRSMAQTIACDIHPIANLRVLNELRRRGQDEEQVREWISTWITPGFEALEAQAPNTPYLGGDQPMLPDVVLVPQMYNARRFEVALDRFPKLVAVVDRCNELAEFRVAYPDPNT